MPYRALLKVRNPQLNQIPIQRPARTLPRSSLDLNIHTSRKSQLVQRLNRFGGRLHDVDHPLVGANFVLLTGLFIDVRTGEDRVSLNPGGERNRAVHLGVGPLGGVDDLSSTLIEHGVIVSLHPDSNDFLS